MNHAWKDLRKPDSGLNVHVCENCGARRIAGTAMQVHDGHVSRLRPCPAPKKR